MIVLLSPAKTLDYNETSVEALSAPELRKMSKELIDILKEKSTAEIMSLMHIKENLAQLNVDRYRSFSSRYTDKNSKAAILAFKGDVYLGLEAFNFSDEEMEYAQDHIRILSGLYGVLKPLDKMQAYRLEMGTSLSNEKGKNLYEFWGDIPTKQINKSLKAIKSPLILNLASNEYFKVLKKKQLKGDILDVNFKEYRDGQLKFISFSAKKARGLMAKFVVKNQIEDFESLKAFDYENYTFDESLSDDNSYTFVR